MTSMLIIFVCFIASFLIFILIKALNKKTWKEPNSAFPIEWRNILRKEVEFYHVLNQQDKVSFEYKVQEFLLNVQILGKNIEVTQEEKVLIAASAVIPIFRFPDWIYSNLEEVYLFESAFNLNLETNGPDRNVLGMVGEGHLEDKMVLSRKALHLGFDNNTDKKNTAIHEFVHLIDMKDGKTDGIPEVILKEPNVIPWIKLMEDGINKINSGKSDIDSYGGTSKIEFFTVASEYFFERPKLLKRKHPELYAMLEQMFNQKMANHGLKEK